MSEAHGGGGAHTGTCTVCPRHGIRIIAATRLLFRHGHHNCPCEGYNKPPLNTGFQISQMQQSTTAHSKEVPLDETNTDDSRDLFADSTQLPETALLHPQCSWPILKQIPRGARPTSADSLIRLLSDIIGDPDDVTCWEKLINFPSRGFKRPGRGGKSRDLTSLVIKQMRECNTEYLASNVKFIVSRPARQLTKEMIAKIASTKLEDGDIRGCIRLLSSDDSIVSPDLDTFNKLVLLHPMQNEDRRPPPCTTVPALQTSPTSVRAAITSFPNGSAGGPDGLRPQHIKDLVTKLDSNGPLLEKITDFVNIVLEGKTPKRVRPILFGGSLTALRKVGGGLRPIAVGYFWRRLVRKVACRHV